MFFQKKKKRIGIDIDNVIADSYTIVVDEFNRYFGKSVKYREVSDFYYLEKYTGVSQKEVKIFLEDLFIKKEYPFPPYLEASKIIKKWWKEGISIHYITARPKNAYTVTYQWLRRNRFLHHGVTLDMFDYDKFTKDTEFKKFVASIKKIDVLIEDSKEIAETLDVPVFLFDRPWNQGKLLQHIIRVNDWHEIDKIISSG